MEELKRSMSEELPPLQPILKRERAYYFDDEYKGYPPPNSMPHEDRAFYNIILKNKK